MADYIYTLETRLSPDQQKAVTLVVDAAKAADMNVYLTGGAVRDVITGFPIRDLDFTVQGNALKLQKELEKAGAVIGDADQETRSLLLTFPGGVRAEIAMARSERYEKTGKPPIIAPATIIEDLRRRDFTVNAMALSLNEGSRGLLMDPFNGVADIELKVIRVLHNYAFLEDPSRMIRATRFTTRFHWPLEERTQARYESGKENSYIDHIRNGSIGYEIEQLAYEDDALAVLKAYEKEGWLKILNPRWSTAKVDAAGLGALAKTRQQMNELGYLPDMAASVLYFLTERMGDKDVADLRRAIPRKDLVEAWKDLEDNARDLAKRLMGKEAATPSRTWHLLSSARPEMVSVSGGDGEAAGGVAEDQEFLYEVAAGAAEAAAAGDDGTADHAADAGVSEDCERCVHAAAGWQAALADGDAEIFEAAGPASATTSAGYRRSVDGQRRRPQRRLRKKGRARRKRRRQPRCPLRKRMRKGRRLPRGRRLLRSLRSRSRRKPASPRRKWFHQRRPRKGRRRRLSSRLLPNPRLHVPKSASRRSGKQGRSLKKRSRKRRNRHQQPRKKPASPRKKGRSKFGCGRVPVTEFGPNQESGQESIGCEGLGGRGFSRHFRRYAHPNW